MLSKQLNKKLLYTLSAIAALSVFIMNSTTPVLQVSNTDFKCNLATPSLSLRWLHSVEKEHWQENYQMAGEQLLLSTTQFKTFGAGTPSTEGAITSKDGWLHYKAERLLPHIHWIVSRNVESTVLTELGIWPLYDHFDDYAEIKIQVMQVPRWHYFTQESCNDYFKKP